MSPVHRLRDDGEQRPRVVIVGGGFGGLAAARGLRSAPVDVVLVDRAASNVFQPLLYQCATGLLSEGQISSPLRALLAHQDNVRVVLGEAYDLDAQGGVVRVKRSDGSEFDVPFDHLVLAAGMRTSYFGHDEFARFAPGMKTLDDALAIRRRLYGAFEYAETLPPGDERRQWLTFAVCGGGPTGVELAGQIHELATRTLAREFRSIDPSEARVLLFDAGDAILAPFGDKLSGKAARLLADRGVAVHVRTRVMDVDDAGLVVSDEHGRRQIPCRTVLWAAGVEAVPFGRRVAAVLGAETDRAGRICVRPDLSVHGHPNVYVVGDAISLDGLPGIAEVALQGGHHAAACIARSVANPAVNQPPFRYKDRGMAAYLCRGHALLSAGPVRLSGMLGWLAWGPIHLAFLATARNRLSATASWLFAVARGTRRERALLVANPVMAPQPYQANDFRSAGPAIQPAFAGGNQSGLAAR